MDNAAIDKIIQQLTVLIVDSNAHMRRMTRTMLTNLGTKSVLEAADGLEALEAIRISDPDVMLLDWDMPILNGIEVMRIVRSPDVFPRPNIPIIMLTSRGHRPAVLHALRAGAREFLGQGVARSLDRNRPQAAADDAARRFLRAASATFAAGLRTGQPDPLTLRFREVVQARRIVGEDHLPV